MPHFVYMLRCKGNKIYTGYSTDVYARFKEHVNKKGAKFTKAFPPNAILAFFELNSKRMALRFEIRIKKLSKKDKETLALGNKNILLKLKEEISFEHEIISHINPNF